jgi:3-hydroxypropanoate dehydrogenase
MSTQELSHPRAIDAKAAALLFSDAHTAYAFDSTPITDEQLSEIYELVQHAPSSMNAQPLRITFVRSPEAKARLLAQIPESNRAKSESAPVVAILAADVDFHENLPRVFPQNPGAKDRFENPEGREQFARFNASIQAGYFILAARAVGLDVGPMAGINAAGIDEEFFAGTSLKTLFIVNLGYASPEGTFPRNPRLEASEVVTVL